MTQEQNKATPQPEVHSSGCVWTLRGGRAFEPAPFGVMGIVNLTPDSFYDGGRHNEAPRGLAHAHRLWAEGAHILDLGAESSRPGADPLTAEQELARLLPVLEPLLQERQGPPPHLPPPPLLSVDTYHAATARTVLEKGVDILNDISACRFDPELLDVVTAYKPGYVLMHAGGTPKTMQQSPRYAHVLDEVLAFFETHLQRLVRAGLPETHIVLDPGIGFGKSFQHNLDVLQGMESILALGRPVLMGLSMKSLFAGLLAAAAPVAAPVAGSDAAADHRARAAATQTATALLAARGVSLHRVHHVAETLRTLTVVRAFAL